jgi:hypothetical protein
MRGIRGIRQLVILNGNASPARTERSLSISTSFCKAISASLKPVDQLAQDNRADSREKNRSAYFREKRVLKGVELWVGHDSLAANPTQKEAYNPSPFIRNLYARIFLPRHRTPVV